MGIFSDEFFVELITVNGLFDGFHLITRHVPGGVLIIFPSLELEKGTLGALSHNGEFAAFHLLNLGDFLEEDFWRFLSLHARSIYYNRYSVSKKTPELGSLKDFVMRPRVTR